MRLHRERVDSPGGVSDGIDIVSKERDLGCSGQVSFMYCWYQFCGFGLDRVGCKCAHDPLGTRAFCNPVPFPT